ncbi:MAG: hypothetical protein NT075_01405 [Chloroflexi bacterium]|nr:hypothetical protein [Chloroflexota bacterium]
MRFFSYCSVLVLFAWSLAGCTSSAATDATAPTATLVDAIATTGTEVALTVAATTTVTVTNVITSSAPPQATTKVVGPSRGYLTTPAELAVIKQKADDGMEPYAEAMKAVLNFADKKWDYNLKEEEKCNENSNKPLWLDEENGVPRLYGRALAYHLTGEEHYAAEVKTILEKIMTNVIQIADDDDQCELNFAWGVPELVASADLIEAYWHGETCTGPLSTFYTKTEIGSGPCKALFQNWLVKNPYYVSSHSGVSSKGNWGAAGTNMMAYIADYLWDRPDVMLVHRNPREVNGGKDEAMSPSEAYAFANDLMLKRMDGYGVDFSSGVACDLLGGVRQSPDWPPVKSQITEKGIVPDDARREEFCNIPQYNGQYENYPQTHLGNNIQQCELLLRRGDNRCFENIDNTDIPEYTYKGPDGELKTTHLYPGRGSIERAIKAVIIDSNTEWRHDSSLAVAYRYYYNHSKFAGIEKWPAQLERINNCNKDVCFGILTHGFSPGEKPGLPPVVSPP